MKAPIVNGFELIQALNNETHHFGDVVGEIKDVNRRRAAMKFFQHCFLTHSHEPQTGIFFWAPIYASWRLDTYFDAQFPPSYGEHGLCEKELDHQTIWKIWASTILGSHDIDVPQEIATAYRSIPHGRVAILPARERNGIPTKPQWRILHGKDAPVENAEPLIASHFQLPADGYRFVFDRHERMVQQDVTSVQRYLGRDLGLLEKAARSNA